MPRARNDGTAAGAPAERATGRELHDRVVALIAANPGMTQSAAFAQLVENGDADGRSPANVAANYYRIERQNTGGRPRAANRNGGRRTSRRRSGSQVEATEQMLDRIERDVTDILRTLRDARASVAAVRDEAARIEAVRAALA